MNEQTSVEASGKRHQKGTMNIQTNGIKTAILTDSNSGITQKEAEALGVYVLPMPFFINDQLFFEDISLSQPEFYDYLKQDGVHISTSMPSPGDVEDMFQRLLESYEEVVYIPMSSGLSGSMAAARQLAEEDFPGRVEVVDNQRISVTQRQSVLDAKALAKRGFSAAEIRKYLEATRFDSSIYITVDTLEYLKKGGRITPAAAAIGTAFKVKPILQIQGEKLDSYAISRNEKRAKSVMIAAVQHDISERFRLEGQEEKYHIAGAFTGDPEKGEAWRQEVQEHFPHHEILMAPLSLSVACHIGPGALALTVIKKMPEDLRHEDIK